MFFTSLVFSCRQSSTYSMWLSSSNNKKKRGKVQHIRGSPKKRKISGKAFFSSESIPGKILADVKNQITDKASELKRADQKKLFLANFPYLMFAYFLLMLLFFLSHKLCPLSFCCSLARSLFFPLDTASLKCISFFIIDVLYFPGILMQTVKYILYVAFFQQQ